MFLHFDYNLSLFVLLGLPWLSALALVHCFNVFPVCPVCRVLSCGRLPRAHKDFGSEGERVWGAGEATEGDRAQHLQGIWSLLDQDQLFCFWVRISWCIASLLKQVELLWLSCFLPSDKAFLHASRKDDDGEQAGSTQGQNSQRSNRDGLQGLLVCC